MDKYKNNNMSYHLKSIYYVAVIVPSINIPHLIPYHEVGTLVIHLLKMSKLEQKG